MPASSSPALASDRDRLSPLPVHSPDSATAGSCCTGGVTTRVSRPLNDRCSSHIPNGSVSRIVNGPSV